MMTNAQKQAAYRQRRDCGDIVLPVRVNLNSLSSLLETLGLLDPRDRDDREAIAQALSAQVENLARELRYP